MFRKVFRGEIFTKLEANIELILCLKNLKNEKKQIYSGFQPLFLKAQSLNFLNFETKFFTKKN